MKWHKMPPKMQLFRKIEVQKQLLTGGPHALEQIFPIISPNGENSDKMIYLML